jgi:uncharacterized membrane protein YkvA (DUF1232 family)
MAGSAFIGAALCAFLAIISLFLIFDFFNQAGLEYINAIIIGGIVSAVSFSGYKLLSAKRSSKKNINQHKALDVITTSKNVLIAANTPVELSTTNNPQKYDDYSDSSFWVKVKKFAKAAGKEVIEKALFLYYAAQESDTPVWAKTIIYSALAYFISPIDAIPDITPVVGYTDDLGALVSALATVSMYVTEDVKNKARQKLSDWFDK